MRSSMMITAIFSASKPELSVVARAFRQ